MHGLLRAAEEGGLPMPYASGVDRWAPHGHEANRPGNRETGSIELQVHTLEELSAAGAVHFRVFGYAGPVPVKVTAVVRVEGRWTA
jgi:hypothetical protein